ncbi:PRC-barrel domain-containing protein [Oscillatoria sp. FACHB-1406]|uniref:PRC-barrel domain-containing protein n=1 Tax=Oscillatoria sp. FACHB-1406 TaxID=2692846 RepID=UPI0016888FB5|nr:PRC-barrel domain-containing protein [Oscillatoria sp. FACHB-1406]MBD2576380.1 PRC-barrel domain-containing protein [Oscillatoria sp. FACHB-1406]
MLKGNFVIGKPIVRQATREPLGKSIQDSLVVSANGNGSRRNCDRIIGFWVGESEPGDETSILPLGAVSAIGKDAIVVDADGWLALSHRSKFQRYRSSRDLAINRQILTLDGQNLGRASDIYFDPETGKIEGYEAFGGKYADPETGKSFVPANRIIEISDREIRVAPETIERMQERKFHECKTPIPPAISLEMLQKAFVVGRVAREQVCTPNGIPLLVSGQLITSAHAAVAQNLGILEQLYAAVGGDDLGMIPGEALTCKMPNPLARAWGRRVRKMVENPDGSIIAAPGQIVTEREIARAIEHHQEKALLDAVGYSIDEANLKGWCKTCSELKTCNLAAWIEAAASRGNSVAKELWESSVPLMRKREDESEDLSRNEQIQNALGRPVVQEIRDRNNSLILEVGDLITYHAVKQAIRAEMLSKLLSAVYEE